MTEHPEHSILMEFMEGSLAHDQAETVRRHLSQCPSCRQARAFDEQLVQSISELALENPSSQFDSRILSTLQKSVGVQGRVRSAWLRPVATGLLIAATLVVIVFAGGSGEPQSESILSPVFEQFRDILTPVTDLLSDQIVRLTPSLDVADNQTIKIFLIASLAMLIIGSLDRLLQPYLRQRGRAG